MADFKEGHWSKREHAFRYLDRAGIVVAQRERMLAVLGSFFRHFLGGGGKKSVLDLGSGDGVLTHKLLKLDASLAATLVDASEDMLERARERLRGFEGVQYIRASFQELIQGGVTLSRCDLAVSSMAIHHLTSREKAALFGYVRSLLKGGGWLVVMDTVASRSPAVEGWHLRLWEEWMAEARRGLGIAEDLSYFVEKYTEKGHYERIDTLAAQMEMLEAAGFRDVDCFYKYGIFAMFGARR